MRIHEIPNSRIQFFFGSFFFNFLQVQGQPGFTMPGGFAEFVAIPRADRNVSLMPPKASCQHQQ